MKQETKCFELTSFNWGINCRHSSLTKEQRGLKLQPEGRFKKLGVSPLKEIGFRDFRGSGTGIADKRSLVYGCFAWVYNLSLSIISTIFLASNGGS